MHRTENFRKLAKIFILTFLCSEMHSTFMQSSATEDPFHTYPSSINGTETPLERAKHQASVRLALDDYIFGEGHICGGAVIAPSVVLTVAQCVYNYKKNSPRHPVELKVVMGTLNRYQRTEQTLVYGVTHIHRPKTFDAQTLRDNIAIIMLERDIPKEHPTVQPITLFHTRLHGTKLERPVVQDEIPTQHTFEVTSWFVTKQQVPFTQLMSINITKLQEQHCAHLYGTLSELGTMCMGFQQPNMSICSQDIGAPLLYKDQLVALVTFSGDCRKSLSPAVYTELNHYAKWIAEQIGDGTNQNNSFWGTLLFILFTIWTLRRSKWLRFAF